MLLLHQLYFHKVLVMFANIISMRWEPKIEQWV